MARYLLATLLCCFFIASTLSVSVINEDLVNKINSARLTWKADLNKNSVVDGMTFEQAKALCGALPGGVELPLKEEVLGDEQVSLDDLPENFNAISNWPQCPTIGTIRDQSSCGSCWAFGAVEAMSDRYCIVNKQNISISSGALTFCCSSCGFGCNGGYPASAWSYWVSYGLPEEGCYPYPFPSCDHHIENSTNPCPPPYDTLACPKKCVAGWNGPEWSKDLHFGKTSYRVSSNEASIMAEIYKYGSVEAAFSVYSDFLTYKSGVYAHHSGSYLGGHAIKLLGWGVEGGVKYWIAANSWNTHWGNKGFFWIKRGTNECGIEGYVVAGLPA